jgi:RNA polymerase sigma factor (sigma-70 family)
MPDRAVVASVDEAPRTRREWHAYLRALGRKISFSGFDKRCMSMGLEKAVTFTIEDPWTVWNAKGMCAKGHRVEGDNAYIRPNFLGAKPRPPKCRQCMRDAAARLRQNKKKKSYVRPVRTECRVGHKLTPQNTRIVKTKQGRISRACVECSRIYARERARLQKLGLPTRTRRPAWLPLDEMIRRYSRRQPNGCVLWAGAYLKKKKGKAAPLLQHKDLGHPPQRLLRPYLWEMMTGQEFPPYWHTKPSCGDYRCIATAHILAKPRKEFAGKELALRISEGLRGARARRAKAKATPSPLAKEIVKQAPHMREFLLRRFWKFRLDIDDILQDALLRLHSYCERHQAEIQRMKALALAVARTTALDWARKQSRIIVSLDHKMPISSDYTVEVDNTIPEGIEDDDAAGFTRAAVDFADPARLLEMEEELREEMRCYDALLKKFSSARRREVFLLRLDGCSQLEIAHQLGISENTVENHLKKAYRDVRENGGRALLSLLLNKKAAA